MLRPIQFVFAYIHNNTGFVSECGTLEIPHPTEIWVISLELLNEELGMRNQERGIRNCGQLPLPLPFGCSDTLHVLGVLAQSRSFPLKSGSAISIETQVSMRSTRERTNRKNGLRLSLWGQMYKNCIKKHGNTYLFFFNFEKYLCIKAKRMFFSRFASRKPQNISTFVARTKFMT